MGIRLIAIIGGKGCRGVGGPEEARWFGVLYLSTFPTSIPGPRDDPGGRAPDDDSSRAESSPPPWALGAHIVGDVGDESRDLAAELEAAEVRIEQLETALRSRIAIEQAKGVLGERFGWTVDEAFDVLRAAARSSRSSIHVLAEQVVNSRDTPAAIADVAGKEPPGRGRK